MKKLYLLRHASADMGWGQKDSDRPLTDFGQSQAQKIAQSIQGIHHVICSNACRTMETLNTIIEYSTKPNKVEFKENLYNANAQTLLEEIQLLEEENVLVVAHNPGIHMLAHDLTKMEATPKHDMLSISYPPCGLTILECGIESWADIEKRQNKLIDFITV